MLKTQLQLQEILLYFDILIKISNEKYFMFISVGHFYQDLTGIEEIDRCRDILRQHNWDIEVTPPPSPINQIRKRCVRLDQLL